MKTKAFDPTQLSVVFGASAIQGFSSDTAISIEFESQQWTSSRDLHGNITKFKVNDSSAKITVTLTQSSPSNDVLTSYYLADSTNAGNFPVMVKDGNGNTLFTSPSAYVEQLPAIEFGAENVDREWVIRATGVNAFIGGAK